MLFLELIFLAARQMTIDLCARNLGNERGSFALSGSSQQRTFLDACLMTQEDKYLRDFQAVTQRISSGDGLLCKSHVAKFLVTPPFSHPSLRRTQSLCEIELGAFPT